MATRRAVVAGLKKNCYFYHNCEQQKCLRQLGKMFLLSMKHFIQIFKKLPSVILKKNLCKPSGIGKISLVGSGVMFCGTGV